MSQESPPFASPRSRGLLLSTALVLLCSLLLAGGYLHFASARQATQATQALGQTLARQTTLLIRPALLADDRISLNYILQQLNELDYVAGLQLSDGSGALIARAGRSEGLEQRRTLLQQEQPIGTLSLWLDSTPQLNKLRALLWQVAVLALAAAAGVLLTLYLASRGGQRPQRRAEPAGQDAAPPAPERFDSLLARQQTADSAPASEPVPEPPLLGPEQIEPPAPVAAGAEPTTEGSAFAPAPLMSLPLAADSRSLVELLRPPAEVSAPKLQPRPAPPLITERVPREAEREPELVLELDETEAGAAAPGCSSPNPLRTRAGAEETQLALYALEQELELSLAPEDAAYLFYIDTSSANAEYGDSHDREPLLDRYRRLAAQVAAIYSGALELLTDGNIQLSFPQPSPKDEHGINALCAAQLFILLYKGHNQSQLRQFQPVLNLHMSLVRGHREKMPLLLEEARFLTATTQSNDLISHTALTEAPQLKQAMLADADIRREDEDKVLLLTVTRRYQELLQKQAEHLLGKMSY